MYKIRFKDILYNTGNIANIYTKWSTTFKNYKSVYCTLVTYNIVHQLYFNKIEKINYLSSDTFSYLPSFALIFVSFIILNLK